MQHTFFVDFFAVALHDYKVKLPETFLWRKYRTYSRSLQHIFSLHWWTLAFLILSPPLQNFHVLTTKKFSLSGFVFIDSLAAPALQDTGGYAISRQNNLELHLGCHACWLSYFTLLCLWCGRTVSRAGGRAVGVRSRDYQNFSVDYHIFLSAGAPRRALLVRELRHDCLNIWANTKMSLLKPPKIICVKSLKITKKNLPATLQKSWPDSFKILCGIERISLSRRHS